MQRFFIERLGHQGDGIAKGPVYVPGTLPGEEIEGQATAGVITTPKIVTPSDDRVRPPCSHAKACGGCQLQHASDSFVSHWKVEVVRNALSAHGLTPSIDGPVTSEPRSRRRASFSARRTKKGALAGFHQKRSDIVVSVPNCQLVHPQIATALPLVEQLAITSASRKGELSVLVTRSEGGLDVSVTGGKPLNDELRQALPELANAYDLPRLTWDGETVALRHPPAQRFGPARVVPPAGAFLQATEEGQRALQDAVSRITKGAARIADLFAGCGTFALPLAQGAEVHAVEGDRHMLRALDQGWRQAQGLKRVTTETRDLFRTPLLPDELRSFGAVVIDPPRAGAQAQVAEIARSEVPRIAYVSCNPVTFARDAAHLQANGFDLRGIVVIDQFRWSTHVELVAEFIRQD
ncbi:MAG: class I SAM-dependent RNA methyltransferase [Rhodobacteraceae bacterium]|nr:class I SAM-dependent RNA methyltransferase [Paracoccaceae bacterium]